MGPIFEFHLSLGNLYCNSTMVPLGLRHCLVDAGVFSSAKVYRLMVTKASNFFVHANCFCLQYFCFSIVYVTYNEGLCYLQVVSNFLSNRYATKTGVLRVSIPKYDYFLRLFFMTIFVDFSNSLGNFYGNSQMVTFGPGYCPVDSGVFSSNEVNGYVIIYASRPIITIYGLCH